MELILSDNEIQYIENLDTLSRLQRLDLARNRVFSLDGLQSCSQLNSLDVNGNRIATVREVEFLKELPYLGSLVLAGNPLVSAVENQDLVEPDHYRLRILVRLQSLTFLDSKLVTAEEKVRALNLHGGEMSDVAHRERVWNKHFPGEAFVDHLPPYVESEPPCDVTSLAASRFIHGAVIDATKTATST